MNRLGEWLEAHKMTQEEFAKRIGAHQTQVSRYVTGERTPSRRLRKDIAEATRGGVPADSWDRPPPGKPRLRSATSHA